ncbi:uncharacterized protein LOC125725274 isoform X4 [Brienomyrus brachyistius]|uniref:uncharacterized protein LOC125725274 isoform X4 n=1 Tax=Brienomyrus brachyistius TaxID=42636 RepID=UPI0020B45C6F|nr:uncharacterized protein LOC125725274 isoform X4 [Brienomyrus brachyistius]
MIWFIFLSLISDLKCMSGDAAAAEIFSVRQEPEVIEVAPGGNVTMKCHYLGDFAAGGEVRVQWKSNISSITTDRVNVTGIQNGSFCLNLTSVRRNQSDSAAGSDTRKDISFVALWTALSMAALTVGTAFLIHCKYKRTKPASRTGENDSQVSDALQPEVQYATLNVRLKSPSPDSRSGQGQVTPPAPLGAFTFHFRLICSSNNNKNSRKIEKSEMNKKHDVFKDISFKLK